jgi:hypothetical protein
MRDISRWSLSFIQTFYQKKTGVDICWQFRQKLREEQRAFGEEDTSFSKVVLLIRLFFLESKARFSYSSRLIIQSTSTSSILDLRRSFLNYCEKVQTILVTSIFLANHQYDPLTNNYNGNYSFNHEHTGERNGWDVKELVQLFQVPWQCLAMDLWTLM